jgi:hypothetical protein
MKITESVIICLCHPAIYHGFAIILDAYCKLGSLQILKVSANFESKTLRRLR